MINRLERQYTQAVMIDMQDRLLAAMPEPEELTRRTAVLLEGLRLLRIPLIISQQYTRGLGMTNEVLLKAAGTSEYCDKITYSCYADPDIRKKLEEDQNRKTVLLFGVESHICLWQTARDLIEAGFQVEAVTDCMSSRHHYDHETALRRLEQAGAIMTTTEACLFELLGRAGTDEFKSISKLIR